MSGKVFGLGSCLFVGLLASAASCEKLPFDVVVDEEEESAMIIDEQTGKTVSYRRNGLASMSVSEDKTVSVTFEVQGGTPTLFLFLETEDPPYYLGDFGVTGTWDVRRILRVDGPIYIWFEESWVEVEDISPEEENGVRYAQNDSGVYVFKDGVWKKREETD